MRFPTQVIGNGALVTNRIVRTGFCRLVGVVGVNNGADMYVQVHETAAVPADNAVPLFSFPADAGRAYGFNFPNPIDLSACTVVASSALEKKTAVSGTPVTIQAILAP